MITSFRMIKYIAIPLILVGCTAPVTDPPAHAEIVTYREELDGEINLYNPDQWMQMYGIYERNRRREIMEQNMTDPKTSINSALEDFWEKQNGSNDSTESEELL